MSVPINVEPCDVRSLRVALRLVNKERDKPVWNRSEPTDAHGAPLVGGWDAVAINLDRMAEDAADQLDHASGVEGW